MDKRVKGLWTAALRSGEFKQTKGLLSSENGMCCLGVLCELYRRENPDTAKWRSAGRTSVCRVVTHHEAQVFVHLDKPDNFGSDICVIGPVKQWSGLSGAEADKFATMNDDGCTFEQIADVIEDKLVVAFDGSLIPA